MSDLLTAFLLARIAEDEAAARAANGRVAWVAFRDPDGHMRYTTVAHQHHGVDEWIADGRTIASQDVYPFYDSARVLARCAADRRIVELRTPGPHLTGDEDVLRLLALPYADHPDYREEWRP